MNRHERRKAARERRPTSRPIPEPIMDTLREEFPKLLAGDLEGEDVYLLLADDKGEPGEAVHFVAGADFMRAVEAYDRGIESLEKLGGEPGFQITLLPPGAPRAVLQHDHLLVEFDAAAMLKDGTRQQVEVPITVGQVREYMADPNPCQCDNCLRVFPRAARLLSIHEDFLSGKITESRMERELKKLGYRKGEKIQHH
jgi:hypothetical protein